MTDQIGTPKPNSPDAGPQPAKGPNCWDCRHLMITWDVRKPYGCKFMGFKSKAIPSLEVLRNDGRFCGAFSAKPAPDHERQSNARSTASVGNPSNRRDSDFQNRYIPINLIT